MHAQLICMMQKEMRFIRPGYFLQLLHFSVLMLHASVVDISQHRQSVRSAATQSHTRKGLIHCGVLTLYIYIARNNFELFVAHEPVASLLTFDKFWSVLTNAFF